MNKNKVLLSIVLAALAINAAYAMKWAKPFPISNEQEEAFNKLLPHIVTLQNKIREILDEADNNKIITPKFNDELNGIQRIKSDDVTKDMGVLGMSMLATKQGLIFYRSDKVNFGLVTPKGTLTLGGYWGECVVKPEDEQAINNKVFALMEKESYPEYTANTKRTWGDSQVYKVLKIDGKEIPSVIPGRFPKDSMYDE